MSKTTTKWDHLMTQMYVFILFMEKGINSEFVIKLLKALIQLIKYVEETDFEVIL